jgi:hypothetical protein
MPKSKEKKFEDPMSSEARASIFEDPEILSPRRNPMPQVSNMLSQEKKKEQKVKNMSFNLVKQVEMLINIQDECEMAKSI